MTVVERLREYAKVNGISFNRMEQDLGKARSYLTQVKNVSSDVLVTACGVYPDLSAEWLLRGEGTMTREIGVMRIVDSHPDKRVELLTEKLFEAHKRIIQLELELGTKNA